MSSEPKNSETNFLKKIQNKILRKKMIMERYSLLSEKALAKAWKNEDDKYWESYLNKNNRTNRTDNKKH